MPARTMESHTIAEYEMLTSSSTSIHSPEKPVTRGRPPKFAPQIKPGRPRPRSAEAHYYCPPCPHPPDDAYSSEPEIEPEKATPVTAKRIPKVSKFSVPQIPKFKIEVPKFKFEVEQADFSSGNAFFLMGAGGAPAPRTPVIVAPRTPVAAATGTPVKDNSQHEARPASASPTVPTPATLGGSVTTAKKISMSIPSLRKTFSKPKMDTASKEKLETSSEESVKDLADAMADMKVDENEPAPEDPHPAGMKVSCECGSVKFNTPLDYALAVYVCHWYVLKYI